MISSTPQYQSNSLSWVAWTAAFLAWLVLVLYLLLSTSLAWWLYIDSTSYASANSSQMIKPIIIPYTKVVQSAKCHIPIWYLIITTYPDTKYCTCTVELHLYKKNLLQELMATSTVHLYTSIHTSLSFDTNPQIFYIRYLYTHKLAIQNHPV